MDENFELRPVTFHTLEENWSYYLVRDKSSNKRFVLAIKPVITRVCQRFKNGEAVRERDGMPVFDFAFKVVASVMSVEEYDEIVRERGKIP